MNVSEFYDDYVSRQVRVGVNDRHRAIVGWLERYGMAPGHRVLEIGCGVGTLTELLAGALGPSGSVVGLDLSPKSIDVARGRLAAFTNVELRVGDALSTELEGAFDVVVLPDVIEHIPLELHPELFARVASWVAQDGFVLLHYPNPHHLAWCREHRPEELQIIDQPIHADALLSNTYANGLYLDFLQTYPIWIREGDYVVAVLRPSARPWTPTEIPENRASLLARLRDRIRRN
jgi:2-polyprenyl-3-methyl-5-hydroxy-6-metoxy-1,4-benzoquinol methylase